MENNMQKEHGVIKEAWHLLRDMKSTYWGVATILGLLIAGGYSLLSVFLILSNPEYLDHLMKQPHDAAFITGVAASVSVVFLALYRITTFLYEMFFLTPLRMGLLFISLRHAVGKSIRMPFFLEFLHWRYIWRFVILYIFILLMLGVSVGLGVLAIYLPHLIQSTALWLHILCNIIAIAFWLVALYLLVSYILSYFAVMDRCATPWQAMELSRRAVTKKWLTVFGLMLWALLINLVGLLLLGVGLIWAMPYSQNIIAILYRDLIGVEGRDPVTMRGE